MKKISKYSHLLNDDNKFFLISNLSGAVIEIVDHEKILFLSRENIQETDFDNCSDMPFSESELKTLVDYQFLCSEDTDQDHLFSSRISEFKDKKELDILFVLTEDCNFRCVYCFENHVSRTLSEADVELYLAHTRALCEKHDIELLKIAFYGGEPLLQFDQLKRIFHKIEEQFDDIKSKDYLLITNGYLLSSEKAQFLKAYSEKFLIQVTVDGPPETHNLKRPLANGMETFHKIIENVENASQFLKIQMRVNVDQSTVNHLTEFSKLLNARPFNRKNTSFDVQFITSNTDYNKSNGNIIDEADEIRSASMLVHNFLELQKKAGYDVYINKSAFCLGQPKYVYCPAFSGKHLAFAPEGYIYFCLERVGDRRYAVGNIYQTEVYYDVASEWLAHGVDKYDKCLNCEIVAFCAGDCGSRAIGRYGNLRPICGIDRFLYPSEMFVF